MAPGLPTRVTAAAERWPIAGTFTIARGSKTEAQVILVEITRGDLTGRGEGVPYGRYGETIEGALDQVARVTPAIEGGLDRQGLIAALEPGAARNAIDAALIDLEAKAGGRRAWEILGLARPRPKPTCYTISLAEPEAMGRAARAAGPRPVLKLKLGRGREDVARVRAVRAAAPDARLVVDANEGWTIDDLVAMAPDLAALGVALIEQPLPAGADGALASYRGPIPLCADESAHGLDDLDAVSARYAALNLKLDKTGGLTSALDIARAARAKGLRVMLGCMVGTSLSMAPASLLMDFADFVDLDGPLLLARDRTPGLAFVDHHVQPPEAALWG